MPVPNSISDLTNIAATNSPAGTESVKGTIDDYLRAHAAFIRQLSDIIAGPTVTLASASNVAIGFANSGNITITGTTSIFGFDNVSEGTMRWVTFTGSLLLVHNSSSLFLPGAVNVQTTVGDVALFKSAGGGNWRCLVYQRISGTGPNLATTVQDGYLSATDWNKFNGKQNAGECLPLSGGTMSGSVTFASGGINFKDSSNVTRQFAYMGGDNWTNLVNGGGTGIRVFSQDGSAVIWQLLNNGATSQTGPNAINANGAPTVSGGAALTTSGTFGGGWKMVDGASQFGQWLASGVLNLGFGSGGALTSVATLTNGGTLSAVTITQTSDERKKKLWQRLPHDFVRQLAGIKKSGLFIWRKGGGLGLGVGAQSLERFMPQAVHTDERGDKTVNYGAAAMVSAVELARALVDVQERLVKLEAR